MRGRLASVCQAQLRVSSSFSNSAHDPSPNSTPSLLFLFANTPTNCTRTHTCAYAAADHDAYDEAVVSSLSTSAEEQHEKMSHQHIVYRLSDYKPLKTVCGVTEENENPLKMMHQQAIKAQSNAVPAATAAVESSSSSSPSSFQSPRPTAPRLGADGNEGDMRWIEMLVINDYDRHQRLGENTEHETLSLSQFTHAHAAAGETASQW